MADKTNPYGAPDTGHVWDDNLRELTNPVPKWWMMGFHASWILVVVYGILYPMWPLVNSATPGILGWTSIKEYKKDLEKIEAVRAPYEDRIKTVSAAGILADDELTTYTVRSAKVLFGDNCAACHGAGGQGNPGYPILADDDWLYGGDLDAIQQSIAMGRTGMMPAHGSRFSEQQIDDLARHVLALSEGSEYAPGQELFNGEAGCFACHGMDGKGVQALGGANLTDRIWRFSPGTIESIRYTITHGVNDPVDPMTRNAEMPSFADKLSESDIKKLTVYVHQLGGGQ